MDFVKREGQYTIDEETYKIYMETHKPPHSELQEQHTAISMEQLHQVMQSSLNAGSLVHNFQLPLSPRQMSTLMLKTNHLSRSLNFNEIPVHLQRNLELDLAHNLGAELQQTLRHEDLILNRNPDINSVRGCSELDLQNALPQNLVQCMNDNLADVVVQNLRTDMQEELNHELDLSHHINRNLSQQDLLNQERRTPVLVQDGPIMEQTLAQRLESTLQHRLDPILQQRLEPMLPQMSTGRLDQRMLLENLQMHTSQRLDSDNLLPMPFHIKSEQDDDYFYDNVTQPISSVNNLNGHLPQELPQPQQNLPHEQLYLYNGHINVPALNTAEQYPRASYPQNYVNTRENPQNLVVHREYQNASPYDDRAKVEIDAIKEDSKAEEPNENLKPTDQNKMYYQEFNNQVNKNDAQKDDLIMDIKGEYHCYKCNAVLTSKRSLKQHTKSCTENDIENNEKLGKFNCTQCSYRCQAPATLKIHERTHTGEKPFSCNFCDYKSGQKNNVAKHILVHMKEKPFRCQYCDYRCAQKNNLVVHERTHTGYKPFACPFCDYRTVQKPNLVKHMYLHTDQKPFSCDVCNYRCVQKTNLTKHKQRHLNEKLGDKLDVKNQMKPYRPRQKSVKCPHCPYRCVQKASLEKHIVFKHNGEFGTEQGLNLMKVADNVDESIQNLSVRRDVDLFDCVPQDVGKEAMPQS